MRKPRMKTIDLPCYYHLYNRIGGYEGELPFTDVDREHAFKILDQVCHYFLVEPIAVAWLGNHFHITAYAPDTTELPDRATIAQRHNDYYGERKVPIAPADVEGCRAVGEEMLDISRFMGVYQQRFTAYFNRVHERRGSLWGGRFKSTLLDGDCSLWTCVKYVELNGVRAGIVEGPADFRCCTWGRFNGSGRHPFQANFLKHMRRSLGDRGETITDDAIFTEFRVELARTLANDRELEGEEIQEAMDTARRGDSMPVRFLRRTRHWVDGAIIGSKAFVQETARHFNAANNLAGHRLSRGTDPFRGLLYCFRRLRL